MIKEMVKEDKERINYMCSYLEEFNIDEMSFTLNHLKSLKKLKWVDLLMYATDNERYDFILKTPHTLVKLACDTLGYEVEDKNYTKTLMLNLPKIYFFNDDNIETALEILDAASSVLSIYVEDGKIKFFV